MPFQGLAAHLLGRTIVVDHIDNGIAIAKKVQAFCCGLVTLEGELLNPGGSMTGGAFKNSSNLLSRRREIEDLEKTVSSAEVRNGSYGAGCGSYALKSVRGCYAQS